MMIQMGISCLLLTLTGLQLLTMSEILPFTVLARVEHLSYTFIDIFICCYRGEELMNEVRFNIYSSNIFRILFFFKFTPSECPGERENVWKWNILFKIYKIE